MPDRHYDRRHTGHSGWWEKFFVRAEQRGVPRSVIGTHIAHPETESFLNAVGAYDFVNCSDVLYRAEPTQTELQVGARRRVSGKAGQGAELLYALLWARCRNFNRAIHR